MSIGEKTVYLVSQYG